MLTAERRRRLTTAEDWRTLLRLVELRNRLLTDPVGGDVERQLQRRNVAVMIGLWVQRHGYDSPEEALAACPITEESHAPLSGGVAATAGGGS